MPTASSVGNLDHPEVVKLRQRTRPLGYTEITPQIREHIVHFIRMGWDETRGDYRETIVPTTHEEGRYPREIISKSMLPGMRNSAAFIMWRLWQWQCEPQHDFKDHTKDVLAQIDSILRSQEHRSERSDILVEKIHSAYPRLHDVDCPEAVMDAFDYHCVEHFYLSQLDVCAKLYVAILQLEVKLTKDPGRTFEVGVRPSDIIRAKQLVNSIEPLPTALRYLQEGKDVGELYIQKGDLRRAAWEQLLALARFAPWFPTEWAFRVKDVNETGFGQLFFGIILQLGGLARSLGWAGLATNIYEAYSGSPFLTVHQACWVNDLVGHAFLQDRQSGGYDGDYHRHLTVMARDAFRWRNVLFKLCKLGFSNELAHRSECGNMTPEDYMVITGGLHRMRRTEDGAYACHYTSDECECLSDTTDLDHVPSISGDHQMTEDRIEVAQEQETAQRYAGMQDININPHAMANEEEMLQYDQELESLRAAAGSAGQQTPEADSPQHRPVSPKPIQNALDGSEDCYEPDYVLQEPAAKRPRRRKVRKSFGRRRHGLASAARAEASSVNMGFDFLPDSVFIDQRIRQLEGVHRESRRKQRTKASRRLQLGEIIETTTAAADASVTSAGPSRQEAMDVTDVVEEDGDQDEKELAAELKVRAPIRDPLAWPEDDFDINGNWADWE